MENIKKFKIPVPVNRTLLVFSLIGLLVFIIGLFVEPGRIWANYLIALFFLLSIALGAGFFISSTYVINAGWSSGIRRVPEAVITTLPYLGLLAVGLFFGISYLYEWSHPEVVAVDTILQGKAPWLNTPFFIGRIVFYFLIWSFLTAKIIKHSRMQDIDSDIKHTKINIRYSAIYMITGAITISLVSFDLLMSLQPHWFSTVFGLIIISGAITSSLAAMTVIMIILRRTGFKKYFTDEHMKDMGRLLMAFSVFWVYMWVSQHMLIWYSNIPEETSYYIFRHFGGWGSLSFINLFLNWAIPFLVLLFRYTKTNDKIMMYVSIILLLGHWLDLYIIVMPATVGGNPQLGIWEIFPILGACSAFLLIVLKRLSKVSIVPINDPYIMESIPNLEKAEH